MVANGSVRYLNQFKQIEGQNGTVIEPIGVELRDLRLVKYKQFQPLYSLSLSEQIKRACFFNLAGSLTTLVGPNSSGKTTLLKAVQLFCHAVKHGTGDCPLKQAKELFGIEHIMPTIALQGVFIVHYDDPTEKRDLELNVMLTHDTCGCQDDEEYVAGPSQNLGLKDYFRNLRKEHVYICVTGQQTTFDCPKHLNEWRPCLKNYRNVSLYRADYGIFETLFPTVVPFNSKSVFDGDLTDLFQRIPKIRDYKEEINKEIDRIFPGIRLCYQEEILQQHSLWRELYGQSFDLKQQGTPILSTDLGVSSEHEKIEQTFENITPCGEGVLQCLTLIITICCAKSNSIITIDEPDAHVFPNAQKLLINFFHHKLEEFSKSNRFYQMIITTHSTDIMQAVKPEEIRQLFPRSGFGNPIEIKSLACIGQLLSAMTDVGASILSHGEFVRLAIHRKLLYLENHDDYNFLNGLIYRSKPELLKLPFTIMGKGGRPHPPQVKQMLLQFGQFLPKGTILHIFVLVDSDLRSRDILDKERKEYDDIQTDLNKSKNPNNQIIKVNIYYHCWAAREWENWLLSNENLLYKMLCDDEIYHNDEAIKILRDQIRQKQPTESIFRTSDLFQHDRPMTTTTSSASKLPQTPTDKHLFEDWLKRELERHFHMLLTKLTPSTMGGIENTSGKEEEELQREVCAEFLRKAGINDDTMSKFGDLQERIKGFIGYQLRQEGKEKRNENKRQQKADASKINKKECGNKWLTDRKLSKIVEPTNVLSETIRKELTKWIDAKLLFHQLTHGNDSTAQNIGLDSYWKQAFAMEKSENNTYKRFFNSLNPQNSDEWPRDFNDLLEKFEKFILAP